MNWILIIVSILIFTEITYLAIAKGYGRKMDFFQAFLVKLTSLLVAGTITGILYFGWKALEEIGVDLIINQLTGAALIAGGVVLIVGTLIGWVLINKYLGNKFIIKKVK